MSDAPAMTMPFAPALAIATRELRSFFRLPVGWVVLALYAALTGAVFALDTLRPGEPATMRAFFATAGILLMAVGPAVSMRLFSEEIRTGGIEPLATAPVGDLALVLGKYLGSVLFLGAILLPTLAFPIALAILSDPKPDPGPIVAGYLALALLGCLVLAVGTAASALTSSQTLAFLATLLVLLGFTLATSRLPAQLDPRLGELFAGWSPTARLRDFARGVIDPAHAVYFLALSGVALSVAWGAVRGRRTG
ncbi:MAG: hypothetical protein EA378_00765 [Phycisphaerales bacterium]|nr:MAG: hypothetical protein EA378_00765 [Phycisphaerales bacterium]